MWMHTSGSTCISLQPGMLSLNHSGCSLRQIGSLAPCRTSVGQLRNDGEDVMISTLAVRKRCWRLGRNAHCGHGREADQTARCA